MGNEIGLFKRLLFGLLESKQKKLAEQNRIEAAQQKRARKNIKRLDEARK